MVFLIEYDRRSGTLKSMKSFLDSDRHVAEAARLAVELAEQQGGDTEVVLLEAHSELELRKTHRRYFASANDLAKSAGDEGLLSSRSS